ncbi:MULTISPECIES: DoxX family protein [unclassified Pseudomonas]|uniref:DoxX family protein n=1 Tax=unclassified Pseudomonas TaxID=196821 RepID=UPI0008814EBA|nr:MULTISPECIES: DoxX family protein [unclassified Pseudomonas]SCX85763.1 DoxX-like family protein [Pseudomonas sp. NFACC37-1]SFO45856.1 DoxX-like family protein [Pseudomonas sp. NFACC24-1]
MSFTTVLIMISDIHKKTSAARWTGRVLGALVVLALLADAGVNLFAPHVLAKNMELTGFPDHLSSVIGGIILVCAVLYVIPRTAVLGAILVTGFLGGAICTHLRLGEFGSASQVISALLGIAAWASLYLRSNAVRCLLPLVESKGRKSRF